MLKVVRELNQLAARYGFEPATRTNGNHLSFRHGVSHRVVFFSGTSGDHRAVERLKVKLRRVAGEAGGTPC